MTELRQFCCVLSGNASFLIEQGIALEKRGFDHLRLSDHAVSVFSYIEFADAWTLLTAIGVKTNRIMLSTGVSDPYRRHPSNLAQCAATLDHVTKGRAALGLGAGEAMSILPFGIKWEKPMTGLREAIIVIKALFEATPEKPVSFKGEFFSLHNAYLQIRPVQKPRLPIYVGALGAKMREMTGELADGWYPWFETPETLKEHLKDIETGLRKSSRKMDEIDVVVHVSTAVSEDYNEALKAVDGIRTGLALEKRSLKEMGYDIKIPQEATIQRIIPRTKFTELLSEVGRQVPKEAIEKVTVIGTPDQCVNKIEKYLEAGATSISIYNCGPDVEKTYDIYQNKIIPYLKKTYRRG